MRMLLQILRMKIPCWFYMSVELFFPCLGIIAIFTICKVSGISSLSLVVLHIFINKESFRSHAPVLIISYTYP